jgi:hypothetical protein
VIGAVGLVVVELFRRPIARFMHPKDPIPTNGVEPVSGPPSTGPDLDAAKPIAGFLLRPEFVNRRVESIRFDGTARFRRRISMDIQLPDYMTGRVVPLGLSEKRRVPENQAALRDFDVYDESSTRLALLSQGQNTFLAFSVLCWLLLYVEHDGEPDPATTLAVHWERLSTECPGLESLLWRIAGCGYMEAEREIDRIESSMRDGRHVRTPSTSAQVRLATAMNDSQLLQLTIRLLGRNYLLLAELPNAEPGARRVLKYQFEDPIGVTELRSRDRTKRARAALGRLASSLGYTSAPIAIRSASQLPTRSLHLEVEAPDGARIHRTEAVARAVYRSDRQDSLRRTDGRRYVDDEAYRFPSLGHVYVPATRLDEMVRLIVWMAPRQSAEFLAALLATAFLTGVLVAADVKGNDVPANYQSALLAIPALVTGWLLVRQHLFSRILVKGLRALITGVAVVSLIAACAAGLGGDWSETALPWLELASVTLLLALAPAAIRFLRPW